MSEIRPYRGKRKSDGQWVYGDVIQYEDGSMSILYKKFSAQGYEATEILNRTFVDPKTVGQWTGEYFTGTRVYKDDFVKCGDKLVLIREIRGGLAPFKKTANGFTRRITWEVVIHGKVIGNIHDNPELKGGE